MSKIGEDPNAGPYPSAPMRAQDRNIHGVRGNSHANINNFDI